MPLLVMALLGCLVGVFVRPVVAILAVPVGNPPSATCSRCALPPQSGQWFGAVELLPPTGRCPRCWTPLTPAWLPEAAAGAAFAAVAMGGAVGWYAVAQSWVAALGTALLLIDSAVQRLPDALTMPTTVGTLVLLVAAATHHESGSLVRAVSVAAAAGVLFTLFALGGMGLGDAKVAVSIGALLGWRSWQAAWLGLVVSFLLAAAVATVLLVTRRGHRKSTLAFGPFLIIGALAAAVLTTNT